ncbi:hypothetical protein H8692_05475 [Mogibacterium sp. NSJ-24]|jgi:DNA-directed RNA polymerase subunit N (RpoN/RPB10)|uniref:Uncharacterized protein n=1 Tax=Lentihominibacter hominis TaxID=2763645 RepID=A0A926I4V1_9FIRM|nr:hypothetical protein [Lentihominibacter hominis]MBC8568214.1 hypothetical protein [Lentihominibacter hominis]
MEIQNTQSNLPVTIEDLSKFVLVGREKLVAVKAEIRAIDKVGLATEVRNQKRDEARMLSEALLDAEMRIGEITKSIPKATKGNQHTGKMVSDSGVGHQTSKKEVVENLGLNMKQVERFETLANNPDIVEQVKAEARENDDLPTRTQVINLAKEKARRAMVENEQIDKDFEVYQEYRKICNSMIALEKIRSDIGKKRAICRMALVTPDGLDSEIEYLTFRIQLLDDIRNYFLNAKLKGGK